MGDFKERSFDRRGSGRSDGRSSRRSDDRGSRRFEDRTDRGSRRFDRNERDDRGSKGFGRRDSNRFKGGDSPRFERRISRSEEKGMFSVICDKCGTKCDVPFRPTGGKPVYCSDCFKQNNDARPNIPFNNNNNSNNSDEVTKKLDEINSKLDKIMEALEL